jgi:hypothetical protein
MTDKPGDEAFDERETARRANAALRVALNTPPKPHKPTAKKTKSPRRKHVSAKPKTA